LKDSYVADMLEEFSIDSNAFYLLRSVFKMNSSGRFNGFLQHQLTIEASVNSDAAAKAA